MARTELSLFGRCPSYPLVPVSLGRALQIWRTHWSPWTWVFINTLGQNAWV